MCFPKTGSDMSVCSYALQREVSYPTVSYVYHIVRNFEIIQLVFHQFYGYDSSTSIREDPTPTSLAEGTKNINNQNYDGAALHNE